MSNLGLLAAVALLVFIAWRAVDMMWKIKLTRGIRVGRQEDKQ
jgi:hypothetical protein